MGLIELMESDSRWQLTVAFDVDSRNWLTRLHKYDDIASPVYIGVADSMLGAIMELDRNILEAQKEA